MPDAARWITVVAGTSPWTKERTDELVRLWVVERLSGSVIAVRLGLNDRNAVMGKIHRLGLKRGKDVGPPSPPAQQVTVAPQAAGAPDGGEPGSHESPNPAARQLEKPKVRLPASPLVEEPSFRGHPVMSLLEPSCRWPVGDPRSPMFRFCCLIRKPGTPYCTEHATAAYQAPDRSPRPPGTPQRGFGRAA